MRGQIIDNLLETIDQRKKDTEINLISVFGCIDKVVIDHTQQKRVKN